MGLIIIREDVKDSASAKFISLDDIKKLPCHSVQLPDHKSKQLMIWEGVCLREVIEKYRNIEWAAIDSLIIKALDGYSSVISGLRMKDAETALCTFTMKGKEWSKKYGYMRIIFPDCTKCTG